MLLRHKTDVVQSYLGSPQGACHAIVV